MRWFSIQLLLAAALWILIWSLAGCDGEKGPVIVGETSQTITSVCYTNIGGVSGVYPWQATYPLGSQHVFCEHQVTAFAPVSYPPGTVACTGNPNGGMVPGLFQVDIWVQLDTSPASYKCARINVPTAGSISYHLAYREVMERGWLGQWVSGANRAHIQGAVLGPGTTMVGSSLEDVYVSGCVPSTACNGTTIVHQNQPATWFQLDSQVPLMASFWLGPTT